MQQGPTASDWYVAIRAIVFSVAAVLAIEIALPLLLELASAPYH